MSRREPIPNAACRPATAFILLALLGTAGCMTRHPTPTSAAGDVVGTIDPMIDSGDAATDQCRDFVCEP